MVSHTFLLVFSLATLFVAVMGAGNEDDTQALYQMYEDAMQKREDGGLMEYLLEKRGRGGSTRRCKYQGSMCTCDYRYGPLSSLRYLNCFKIAS